MFCVRDIKPADFPQVYEFTLKLLRHHIGQCERSFLEESDLSQLFINGFLSGLLLVQTTGHGSDEPREVDPNQEQGSIGFMIFHTDVSLTRGGRGICLDQFYIEPEFRRLGLGHMMMSVLCRRVLALGGNYIKLVYQDGLGLEPVYGKMGFVNHSKGQSGLHLFEAYGKPKLQEFLELAGNNLPNPTSPCDPEGYSRVNGSRPHILVVPLSSSVNETCTPTWTALANGFGSFTGLNNFASTIPGTRLVVVADQLPPNSSSLAITHPPNDSLWLHPRVCLFLEQCSICSWLGPMVNFSDFVGDTSVLTGEVIFKRIQSWISSFPQISGAVWEVPMGINRQYDSPNTELQSTEPSTSSALATTLHRLDVPDDTDTEGWNIVYLDKPGMLKLIETRPPKGVDKWCTCPRLRPVSSGFR